MSHHVYNDHLSQFCQFSKWTREFPQAVSTVSGKVSPFVSLESLSIIKKWDDDDDDDDDDDFPVPSLKTGMMRSTSKVAQNVAPGLLESAPPASPSMLPVASLNWGDEQGMGQVF